MNIIFKIIQAIILTFAWMGVGAYIFQILKYYKYSLYTQTFVCATSVAILLHGSSIVCDNIVLTIIGFVFNALQFTLIYNRYKEG